MTTCQPSLIALQQQMPYISASSRSSGDLSTWPSAKNIPVICAQSRNIGLVVVGSKFDSNITSVAVHS
jgi:hypothetical protein